MANIKISLKNRSTARIHAIRRSRQLICTECGIKTLTGHFVAGVFGVDGFWMCPKYYDASGKRLTR